MKSRASDIILDWIDQERDGSEIDRELVKRVITLFKKLDKLDMFYDLYFKAWMLNRTEIYYSRKALRHIEEDSCPSYLLMVEECLRREKDRVAHYLLPETEFSLLMKTQVTLLIKPAYQLLGKEESGLCIMLQKNQKEELSRMYKLFSKIYKGLEPAAFIFKEHVKSIGEALIRKDAEKICRKKAESNGDTIEQEKALIDNVIKVHQEYLSYCDDCLEQDTIFQNALQEAFESFCNMKIDGVFIEEILASYIDSIIQDQLGPFKGLYNHHARMKLEEIVKLLVYLNEKDLFANFYRRKLSLRLLQNRDASTVVEMNFLKRLKQQFGNHFTHKMERMIEDLTSANNREAKFKEYLKKNPPQNRGPSLKVTTLNSWFWPKFKSCNFNLPAEMNDYIEDYGKYTECMKRKITWVFALGDCNVTGIFERKQIDLQVSAYQAAILFLFNTSDKMSFQEIYKLLRIPEIELKGWLHSLCCGRYKILRKEPNTKEVSSTDFFEFNSKFTGPRTIEVQAPSSYEKENLVEKVKAITGGYNLGAIIVRTVKDRKILRYQELIDEVKQAVKRLFKPSVEETEDRPTKQEIEEKIEYLVDLKFLARLGKDKNVYVYSECFYAQALKKNSLRPWK
ncbi:hypothetical protein Syun_007854 [Stephania yunnanensis]|uniref:Cullin-5 n=1 Tax=Stephania yunnanensis TaxID=152371 RepID=A0AAP0PZ55_9MAGN